MDKFVRCVVDGQTRNANSKEDAKQSKHACMVSKRCSRSGTGRKSRKQTRQKQGSESRNSFKGQGPGRPRKAVGPMQQPPPAQPYQSETRTAQRKTRGRTFEGQCMQSTFNEQTLFICVSAKWAAVRPRATAELVSAWLSLRVRNSAMRNADNNCAGFPGRCVMRRA
eukprot:1156449-Pelagomonas_calceolata.AAC.6